MRGLLRPPSVPDEPHDLGGRLARVGGRAQGHDLPHEDAEGPDVGLGGVAVVVERLGRHPADGEAALGLALVDVVGHHVAGEAEVSHLAHLKEKKDFHGECAKNKGQKEVARETYSIPGNWQERKKNHKQQK